MAYLVQSGQLSDLVRGTTGANSTVIALPYTVTSVGNLRLAGDFGDTMVRVAVHSITDGWRVYDPITVTSSGEVYILDLSPGDDKLSIGRDAGNGIVGWTTVITA